VPTRDDSAARLRQFEFVEDTPDPEKIGARKSSELMSEKCVSLACAEMTRVGISSPWRGWADRQLMERIATDADAHAS